MIVSLQTHRMKTLEDLRRFLSGSEAVDIVLEDRRSAYRFVRRTLVRFRYHRLRRPDKGVVLRYLSKMTGKSRPQIQRLVRQHRETGDVRDRRGPSPHAYKRVYTKADIGVLAEVDAALGQMCGHSTRAVMRRMYEQYGDKRFERLAGVSNGHFYNLRNSVTYRRRRTTFRKTRARQVSIGERRKPRPEGRPGYLRVDTVHQGEQDGEKGVFHINVVDEVTQWEHVGTVRAISENCLLKVLRELIKSFPFHTLGFHSDNGSEYVNNRTVEMLNSLQVEQFTKSRARRSNDNALVESKNGNVVRRHFGYGHIPKLFARECNAFARDVLNPYLNLHRPCLFATEITDEKGRTRKRYRDQDVMTPLEKLKSLPDVDRYLRPGVTIAALEKQARAVSDLDAANALNQACARLFELIQRESRPRSPRPPPKARRRPSSPSSANTDR